MKKYTYTLIAIIVAIIAFSFSGYAQTDSTGVDLDKINGEIKDGVIPAVLSLLGAFGIKVGPFGAIITGIVMWIIRRIEKKKIKADHVAELKTIVANSDTSEKVHVSFIHRLINKIEGKKTQ